MSVCLCIHLWSVSLLIRLSTYMFVYLSSRLYVCPCPSLSVCLSIRLWSVCLFIRLKTNMFVYLSICLSNLCYACFLILSIALSRTRALVTPRLQSKIRGFWKVQWKLQVKATYRKEFNFHGFIFSTLFFM
jgi:hypothetical protein